MAYVRVQSSWGHDFLQDRWLTFFATKYIRNVKRSGKPRLLIFQQNAGAQDTGSVCVTTCLVSDEHGTGVWSK